jgi:hypothetical protein
MPFFDIHILTMKTVGKERKRVLSVGLSPLATSAFSKAGRNSTPVLRLPSCGTRTHAMATGRY